MYVCAAAGQRIQCTQRDSKAKLCRFSSTPLQLIWNGYIPLSSSTMALCLNLGQPHTMHQSKEAGATRNCHIKPIVEKWMKADLAFWSCAVSCVPEGVTHVQAGIHPKWLTARPVLFFFSLSLFIFSCGLYVKKRSTEHNFQEIILLQLQTFVFRKGFKVQMYTFFDSPPLPSCRALRQGRGREEVKKLSSLQDVHFGGFPMI